MRILPLRCLHELFNIVWVLLIITLASIHILLALRRAIVSIVDVRPLDAIQVLGCVKASSIMHLVVGIKDNWNVPSLCRGCLCNRAIWKVLVFVHLHQALREHAYSRKIPGRARDWHVICKVSRYIRVIGLVRVVIVSRRSIARRLYMIILTAPRLLHIFFLKSFLEVFLIKFDLIWR